MTDKQIIIDNIDVSGCGYYDKNKPLLTCICEEYPCSECPNCYYKQLKRKEQECKALREEKAYTDMACEQLQQQLDQLKSTLQEIKEIAEDAKTKVFVDMEEFWKQILQKIRECEVGND